MVKSALGFLLQLVTIWYGFPGASPVSPQDWVIKISRSTHHLLSKNHGRFIISSSRPTRSVLRKCHLSSSTRLPFFEEFAIGKRESETLIFAVITTGSRLRLTWSNDSNALGTHCCLFRKCVCFALKNPT